MTFDYPALNIWRCTAAKISSIDVPNRAQRTPSDVRLDTSLELLLERAPANPALSVLATILTTAGSTYRKSGARMLIMADRSYHGLLSGGCFEADLCHHAAKVLESGQPSTIRYDMRSSDDMLYGIGAGCEGAMDVFLEPAGPGSLASTALAATERAIRAGEPTRLLTVHESADLPLGTYAAVPPLLTALVADAVRSGTVRGSLELRCELDNGPTRSLLHILAPSPHLLICGAGPDARPVASVARALGWRITVVDHRPAYTDTSHFPGAEVLRADPGTLRSVINLEGCHAAVVMSHHLASDVGYLRELAAAGVPGYVGLLGPAARRDRILSDLGPAAETLRSQLRGPVGLDIGAVTAEGIALATISQIHGWLANRTGSDGTMLSESALMPPAQLAGPQEQLRSSRQQRARHDLKSGVRENERVNSAHFVRR